MWWGLNEITYVELKHGACYIINAEIFVTIISNQLKIVFIFKKSKNYVGLGKIHFIWCPIRSPK